MEEFWKLCSLPFNMGGLTHEPAHLVHLILLRALLSFFMRVSIWLFNKPLIDKKKIAELYIYNLWIICWNHIKGNYFASKLGDKDFIDHHLWFLCTNLQHISHVNLFLRIGDDKFILNIWKSMKYWCLCCKFFCKLLFF